jgi:hypothetical protein
MVDVIRERPDPLCEKVTDLDDIIFPRLRKRSGRILLFA